MKKNIRNMICLVAILCTTISSNAQYNDNKIGLPGDNLNLYAVMDIFQNSKTLEEFEATLNKQDSKVNNLDLDNDGMTDYIKVIDHVKGNSHSIVMQTDLNRNESQDIAVFYVEKNGSNVDIQLVGDEDLYGKNYIIEPDYNGNANSTPNPGYRGSNTTVNNYNTTNNYNNRNSYSPRVSNWLIVSYMYGYGYNPWRSPWYWGYYPNYYRPWSCYYWYDYNYYWNYGNHWNNGWYYRSNRNRFHNMNSYYNQRRRSSLTCRQKQRNGDYNRTYQASDNRQGERQKGMPLVQANSVRQMPVRNYGAAEKGNVERNQGRNIDTRSVDQNSNIERNTKSELPTRSRTIERESKPLDHNRNIQREESPSANPNSRNIEREPRLNSRDIRQENRTAPNNSQESQGEIQRNASPRNREIQRESRNNRSTERAAPKQKIESAPSKSTPPSRSNINNSRPSAPPSRPSNPSRSENRNSGFRR